MTKQESKYFSTALKMDKAFLELLAEKDFAYITVKEICRRASVNRSTFYLHYENLSDLLKESGEHIMAEFLQHFQEEEFCQNIKNCPLDELILITPRYLFPYLSYIRDNKKLFCTMVEHSTTLGLEKAYQDMFRHIFDPILERFLVPQKVKEYTMIFYICGIVAMIMKWLKNGCLETVEEIAQIIMRNIRKPEEF